MKNLELFHADVTVVSNNEFVYPRDGQTYIISVVNKCCSREVCKLWCVECSFCCHVYRCSCTDFQINNISCKDIHLVHQRNNSVNDVSADDLSDVNCVIQVQVSSISEEIGSLLSMVSKKEHNIEELKLKIQKELDEISISIASCTSEDESNLKVLLQKVKAAKHTFKSVQSEPSKQIALTKKVHPNQNVQRQVRFVSTKKKRKPPSQVVFAKQTNVERKRFLKI